MVDPTPEEAFEIAKATYKEDVQKLATLVNAHIAGNYPSPGSFIDFLRTQTKAVTDDVKEVKSALEAVNVAKSGGWLQ